MLALKVTHTQKKKNGAVLDESCKFVTLWVLGQKYIGCITYKNDFCKL